MSLGLTVLCGNPARRLYERLGFEVVQKPEHFATMQVTPRGAAAASARLRMPQAV